MALHFAYDKSGIDTCINLNHADNYDGDNSEIYVGDTVPPNEPQSNAVTFSQGGRHVRVQRAIRPYDPVPEVGTPYDET